MDSNGNVYSALWPDELVSARLSNRDEPLDEVEASDFRAVFKDEVVSEPTACLGPACPMSADVCDVCRLNPEWSTFKRLVLKTAKAASINDSDQDGGLGDAFLSAPMARGTRCTGLLRLSAKFRL